MPKEHLSAGAGVYASAVMASEDPFCGVAAGWRLRVRICGHGETFLSAECPLAGVCGSASVVTARRSFLLNDGPGWPEPDVAVVRGRWPRGARRPSRWWHPAARRTAP